MEKFFVTMSDIQRYKVLTEVIEKRLTVKDASKLLSLSMRHTLRLKKKVRAEGLEGLLRRPMPSPPNRKIRDSTLSEIIRLRKELYYDFNVAHFKDKLEEAHQIRLCYESLRQILIKNGQHHPRKRKIIHRQRRRMPKAGMMVQMDSSEHQWLEHIPEKWWLIAMIDDATNEVPYAQFFPKDTLFANMHVIRRFIKIKGIFMSLYADKASHFKTTRHGGLHYSVNQEQDDTQIERALKELGITIIPANSPQAKGRIEVTFRLFQDRLIKEMRLAGIKDYDRANQFILEKFLPWYNTRYTHQAESAYAPLPKDINLDFVFCIKKQRTVNNDNTITFNGQVIQIPPSQKRLNFAKRKVDVCFLEDQRVFVLYEDAVIAQSILSTSNKTIAREKKIEELLNKRQYTLLPKTPRPAPLSHPWRKVMAKEVKLKQIKQTQVERKAQKKIENLFGGLIKFAN